MARKADKTEIIAPHKIAEMMSALYPVRAKRNGFARFRYDFTMCPDDAMGVCLYPRKDGRGMKRILARYAEFSNRPYRKVFEEVIKHNTAILIVYSFAYEYGSWSLFLLVAIHEYAHYLNRTVGSIYKWDFRVNTFERTLGLLEEFNNQVYGKRKYKKIGPLFGGWCVWDGTHEQHAHDPLFYFILYFLERKAQEMEYFGRNAKPLYEDCL
jgi:hypothetical protein